MAKKVSVNSCYQGFITANCEAPIQDVVHQLSWIVQLVLPLGWIIQMVQLEVTEAMCSPACHVGPASHVHE